ncbi:MAG: hypothetical protein ACW99Q_12555, partial [Candidatus Kariarchaeaceae archaeon]
GSANHVNLVIVDSKGNLRGFSDSYIDGHVSTPTAIEFRLLFNDDHTLKISSTFEFFMIISLADQWIIDIVSPRDILPIKIAQSTVKNLKLSDDKLIEEGILTKLTMDVGKKTFQTFLIGDLIAVFILKLEEKKVLVEDFINNLLLSKNFKELKRLDLKSLKILIQLIDEYPYKHLKVEHVIRVFEEGSIENPMNINDSSIIPPLVKSVFNQKSYPDHLLIAIISMLSGQKTLIDLIESGYVQDFQEILQIMDFIRSKF